MHIVSQIIEKNLHRREACVSGLWINPEKDDLWRKAKTNCASLKLVCQEFGAYRFHQQTGAEVEFSAFPEINKDKYKWIILNLPRQKALLGMMLDCAATYALIYIFTSALSQFGPSYKQSGGSEALRPHSPLRTERESFPSNSSSISKDDLVGRPGCITSIG